MSSTYALLVDGVMEQASKGTTVEHLHLQSQLHTQSPGMELTVRISNTANNRVQERILRAV